MEICWPLLTGRQHAQHCNYASRSGTCVEEHGGAIDQGGAAAEAAVLVILCVWHKRRRQPLPVNQVC